MLATLFTGQRALAQGTQTEPTEKVDMNTGLVVWTGSTVDKVVVNESDLDTERTKYFFLVEFKKELDREHKELYMGARGDYGVQGILSSVGMRMQLVKSTREVNLNNAPQGQCYQFVSRIDNADQTSGYLGDRMGFDDEDGEGHSVYLDRSGNRYYWDNDPRNCTNFPNWVLNEVSPKSKKTGVRYKGEDDDHDVEVTTYIIQNAETQYRYDNWDYNTIYKPTYITVENGKLVSTTDPSKATEWIIVSEEDFEDAMAAVTWGEVDLGVFVQDASFGRDNKDGIYWVWSTNGVGDNPGSAETDPDTGKTLDGINLVPNSNDGKIHWHQRNQDIMINGVMLAQGEKQVRHQDGNNVWYTYETTRETIGTNVAGTGGDVDHNYCRQNFAQYYSAEIYNEKNSLTQQLQGSKIPNLIDGLYKVTAQALYYDDAGGTTNNGVAYFVVKREVKVNGVVDPSQTTTEYMPIKPMMDETTLGPTITPRSGVSAGYVFNNNERAYLLTTFVEISGDVILTIGIEQREAVGWTVIGNVHFYAHGKQALMIDEDWDENTAVEVKEGDIWKPYPGNPYGYAKWYDNYDYPSTVYYQRTFKKNGWNTICMPMDLTGRQVRQAFGEDAMVCEFLGQLGGEADGCILFSRPPNLDMDRNMDAVVIEAGKPYIIYVTTDPQRKMPETTDENLRFIEVEVGNGEQNHTVKIKGDCYLIPGVIKDQYVTALYQTGTEGNYSLKPPKDVTYTDAKYKTDLHFTGSFYHKVITAQNGSFITNTNENSDLWVITKGNMYHLTGTNNWNVWATYAYLYRPRSSGSPAKALSFAIDDGYGIQEIATSIEGLYVVSEENNVEDYEVYNLSGTKVGKGTLDALPKGIYIMNGKKYVKK